MTTPEGRIKNKLNAGLREISRCYKFMPVQMGMGAPTLDYLLCCNGVFVSIETKAPGKTLTPRQEQTAQAIRNANGVVLIVDSMAEVDFALDTIRKICQSPSQKPIGL